MLDNHPVHIKHFPFENANACDFTFLTQSSKTNEFENNLKSRNKTHDMLLQCEKETVTSFLPCSRLETTAKQKKEAGCSIRFLFYWKFVWTGSKCKTFCFITCSVALRIITFNNKHIIRNGSKGNSFVSPKPSKLRSKGYKTRCFPWG